MELAFRILIHAELDVHLAIHRASIEVKKLSFDLFRIEKLKTSISELGYNILKYAKMGTLSAYIIQGSKIGIKIIAADRGPGIADIESALRDHYSTSGTLGLGLPEVRRLMDDFYIKSKLGEGTEVSIILYGASF